MTGILLFFISSIIITAWFIIYIFTIFGSYEEEKENEFQEILKEIKDPSIFNQLVTGNTIERIVIKGEINLDALKENIVNAQKNVDDITEELNKSNFEQQIQELKIKSYELKNENEQLNAQLLDLQKEFDDIVFGTSMVSTRSILPNSFRFNTNSSRSRNKELLHYLYKDIKDPFNIISDN